MPKSCLTEKCFDSQLKFLSPSMAAVLPHTGMGLPVWKWWWSSSE